MCVCVEWAGGPVSRVREGGLPRPSPAQSSPPGSLLYIIDPAFRRSNQGRTLKQRGYESRTFAHIHYPNYLPVLALLSLINGGQAVPYTRSNGPYWLYRCTPHNWLDFSARLPLITVAPGTICDSNTGKLARFRMKLHCLSQVNQVFMTNKNRHWWSTVWPLCGVHFPGGHIPSVIQPPTILCFHIGDKSAKFLN